MHRAEQLTLVFQFDTVGVRDILGRIGSVLSNLGLGSDGFMFYGQPPAATLSDAITKLERRNRTTFNLVGQGYEFELGRLKNSAFEFLSVKEKETLTGRGTWDEWAMPFIMIPSFVMAWVSDVEYQFWQNACDPLQYTSARKPFDHLPMKSNGLPYPLEQTIIDTSKNPGRRVVRNGYYEAVGSVMWLGEHFWRLTRAAPSLVQSADWLRPSLPVPSVIRLEAAETSFSQQAGRSGELQKKLRELLFPHTVPASEVYFGKREKGY